MRHRLLFVLTCAVTLACDADAAEPGPYCSETVGCPAGTRCVDGARCELLPGATPPRHPPMFERNGGGARRPVDPGGGPPTQRDGGTECPAGLTRCRGACVDLTTDPLSCGLCGRVCAGGVDCRLGVCCPFGFEVCGDRCVDLQTDPDNCGVCDLQCFEGLQCVFGTCSPPDVTLGPSTDPGVPGFQRSGSASGTPGADPGF